MFKRRQECKIHPVSLTVTKVHFLFIPSQDILLFFPSKSAFFHFFTFINTKETSQNLFWASYPLKKVVHIQSKAFSDTDAKYKISKPYLMMYRPKRNIKSHLPPNLSHHLIINVTDMITNGEYSAL